MVYYELFHDSVDAALDASLDIVPLSIELRMHWVAKCMPDANCKVSPKEVDPERQEHQMVDYACMARSEGFLNFNKMLELLLDIPRGVTDVNGADYEGPSLQEEVFLRVMTHQGLLTLRILQSERAMRQELPKEIRQNASVIPTEKVRLARMVRSMQSRKNTLGGIM